MSNQQPKGFELDESAGELRISWTDGKQTRHSMNDLRRLCPCATCRTEREKMQNQTSLSSLRVISSAAPTVDQARILKVIPVGRYALSFGWNDGHHTGIYSYQFLLEHSV